MLTKKQVIGALRECYDPEIPVNIVDLGLIYDVRIEDDTVEVDMTMTARGCPMHGMMAQMTQARLEKIEGIKEAKVNIVWDPPWTPDRMSDEAKKRFGFA